jgi:adenylate cyclase
MLVIRVRNGKQDEHVRHAEGPLEFGRASRRQLPRFVIDDDFVSRDHLQIEERPGNCVRVCNLSQTNPIHPADGPAIPTGASRELPTPVRLRVGGTTIDIEAAGEDRAGEPAPVALGAERYQTLAGPLSGRLSCPTPPPLSALGEAPAPQQIAQWLETVIELQRAAAGPEELHRQAARALVELVGLDAGMVLLRCGSAWAASGRHVAGDCAMPHYSQTLLNQVVAERRTLYQDEETVNRLKAQSLLDLDAVVATPIFGLASEVSGVLYGVRGQRNQTQKGIRPLEAQVVQLLAAAVGANLARTAALRMRLQLEQFFSPELVAALERDPGLLEGRDQEVTVLFSDLRGFTSLSERLGPQVTCRVMRDLMDQLSECLIAEGGAIVDYAGDGILAMWNAPVAQEDHAIRACRAARAMLRELPDLNARWGAIVGAPLALGIGINTGPAQVGNTGSSRKLHYGPRGLTVNLASRIQDATKRLGMAVLIAPSTRQQAAGRFAFRELGAVSLAGISGEVVLYELGDEQGRERS